MHILWGEFKVEHFDGQVLSLGVVDGNTAVDAAGH
jgi:hypothetical protein